jgi:hypothetical protein
VSNLLDVKRSEIATALASVLPDGRFTPYPRPMTRSLAPAGWVEQPTGNVDGSKITATFPVWFVYDGTDEAQVAGLDDLVAKAWAALTRIGQIHPRRWRPAAIPSTTNAATGETVTPPWRAVVIDVDTTMLAVSFCLPDAPSTVDIPPALVQL